MSMLFKRIKDWAVSITSFRTGDVIAVDGPNGTANMSKDSLLQETAQSTLAGNIAPAFDPTRTENDPYIAYKDSCVYEGELYECITNHYGEWVAEHFARTSVEALFAKKKFGTDNIKNLATASDNDLVVGNYFVIDSLDGPKKLGSEVIGNMAKTLDNLYKLSHDNYYNINTPGAFTTTFQVQAKKQYSFYLKSESLVSTQGKFHCLYVGSNSIEDCTADELYNGVYFKYTATSSGYVGIRTYETGVVVRLEVFEIENATSIASVINDKCDKIFNTYSESITFSQTTPQTTSITLKQGFKYRLYAKSDSLITSVAQVSVFYLQENPQTPATSLGFINSYKVLDGFEFEYTAPVSGSLLARSNQAGITLNVVVKEEIPFATVDDVNKVDSNVKDIEKDVYCDRDFDISMYINQTYALDTTFHLHKDRHYTLYAKSDILVTTVSSISIFYRKTSGGSEVIASCSPQELLDGFTVDIYNETDGILFVRTSQTGVFLTCTVTAKDPTTSGNNQFIGKSWAAYGDSIAAISNGNGLMTPGWARYVNDKMPFENFFGRSIGGTRFAWGNGGGSVSFVHTDGSYDSRNDSYNKDNYTGTIPSGCTAIRGCLCSWDRITHMFPESIKNDIDIVCIMGGTNDDFSVTDASFIDGNVTDVEWSQSGADYYGKFNGDFNIDTIKGGLASAIMKFQVWMPNAIVVVCTPLSGHSIGGAGYVATNLYEITFDKRTAVEEIAKRASCPCIDVYSICGISPFNRTEYITDKVHPYTDAGKKMLARALIMGLKNIEPMI